MKKYWHALPTINILVFGIFLVFWGENLNLLCPFIYRVGTQGCAARLPYGFPLASRLPYK